MSIDEKTETLTNDIAVTWRTPGLIVGAVRDNTGVHDVRWTSTSGWTCSCKDGYCGGCCCHCSAMKEVTS